MGVGMMTATKERQAGAAMVKNGPRAVRQRTDYIASEDFSTKERVLEKEANALLASLSNKAQSPVVEEHLYSHGMGNLPVLGREEEAACFRAMNFLKHQIKRIQKELMSSKFSHNQAEQLRRYSEGVRLIRDHLIHSNLRLVIAVVKKFVSPQFSFDELYSEGVVTLMQAVEKFDYERGFRFSTYAYRSISRALYNCAVKQQQQNTLFVEDSDQWVSLAIDEDANGNFTDQLWRSMRDRLSELVQKLDRREQLIVRARYALSPRGKIKTFQTLANKLGISKERVRQLEQRAVAKLQAMATEVEVAG